MASPTPYSHSQGEREMKKSLLSIISILLIAAFALTACAPAAPAATAAPAAAPITVTFWHAYGTGSAEEAALTKVLAQAAIDMPQYKINVLQIPFADIFNKYRTDVAAGSGPDMFVAPNDSLGDDARAGMIADITSLSKDKLTGVSQLGIDGMTLDGKLYGIPESLKALTLWYNKSMMPTPPKTWDDVLKAMQAGTPISLNYGCYQVYGLYTAFGGNIFDAKWKVVADQGGVVDTFKFLNTAYQVQKKAGWAMNDSDGLAPFSEGKLAAIMNGNWAMADYKKGLGDKLATVQLPAGPSGVSKPMLGVDGYYINPNSKNKEAAIAVALYLSNAKSQTTMMNEAGHVPVRTDVTITDPLIKSLVDAFNVGATVRPQVKQLGNYWSNFCSSDSIFEKGIDPAKFVTDATTAANKAP